MKEEDSFEKMSDALESNREMYVPRVPLKFDSTGKLLIYQTDNLIGKRNFFRAALIPPSLLLYCGMRAIQKRSWWRILLWSIPSIVSTRIIWNALNMMTITLVKMELKDDGESLILHTMLWEGLHRKLVCNIREV